MTREFRIMRITLVGAVANCLLTIVKIVAGLTGHSAAMIADGIHSLTDLVSDFIVMLFVKISSRDSDSDHEYGHGKFETLATLLVGAILMLVAVKLFYGGMTDIIAYARGEELPVPGMIALYMAGVSIVVKEVLYQVTARVGRSVDSQAVLANAWHHRTDAISSVGSMLGIAGAIFMGHRWVVLDPLAGCVISFFIFAVSVKMVKNAVDELMEASLPQAERDEIVEIIGGVAGINNVHELKTRRNGRAVIIDAHVVVNPHITVLEAHEMTCVAEHRLRERFGSESHIYIHIEPSEDSQ